MSADLGRDPSWTLKRSAKTRGAEVRRVRCDTCGRVYVKVSSPACVRSQVRCAACKRRTRRGLDGRFVGGQP